LPLLAAALLPSGASTYRNVPRLADVRTMAKLLRLLGWQVDGDNTVLTIAPPTGQGQAQARGPVRAGQDHAASVLVLGRWSRATAARGYRCPAAARSAPGPIDQHLKGLAAMGAKVVLDHGYVDVECKRLRGAIIALDVPTVTGCENLMMAAVLAKGRSVIENAAREPESRSSRWCSTRWARG